MKNLKIQFLPNGGFLKDGAFVESRGTLLQRDENKIEFQRIDGNLTLELACQEVSLTRKFTVFNEDRYAKERSQERSLFTRGKIQPTRSGNLSLSIFGEDFFTEEVDVEIHEAIVSEAVKFIGAKINPDIEHDGYCGFILEMHLVRDRFDSLLKDLNTHNSKLKLTIQAHRFSGFYIAWSPSCSDRRVIKYLQSRNDLENSEDVPDVFWRGHNLQLKPTSNPKSPAVSVSIIQKLQAADNHVGGIDQQHGTVEKNRFSDMSCPWLAPLVDYKPVLDENSKRSTRGIFWFFLLFSLIFIGFVIFFKLDMQKFSLQTLNMLFRQIFH